MDDKIIGIILLVGVIALPASFFGGIIAMNAKNDPPKKMWKYDERQIAVQRKAYQYAFFTLLGYLLVFTVLDSLGIAWCTTAFGLSLGILLSFLVCVTFCIFCDAFFCVSEGDMLPMVMITNWGIFIGHLLSWLTPGDLIENGCFTNSGIPLLIYLTIVSIDVCILVHWIQEKRAKKASSNRCPDKQ